MKIKFTFLFLLVFYSCSETKNNRKNLETDIWFYHWTNQYASDQEILNKILSEKIDSLDQKVITIASNSIDTLNLLQQYVIEQAGGFENSSYIKNPFLEEPFTTISKNPFGLNKHYLNRLAFYLRRKGFDVKEIHLTALDSDEDGIYMIKDPREPSDHFKIAFSGRNVYQILTIINHYKIDILNQERIYMQSKVKFD